MTELTPPGRVSLARVTTNCTARRSKSRIVEPGYQRYRSAQDCPYAGSHATIGEFAPHSHFASLSDPLAVGQLLRAIDAYPGEFVTGCALRLSPLLFVRPGELRAAEWSEIDLAKAEWRIPAARMKMRTIHIVPLATQAISILKELKPLTGRRVLVFPGAVDHTRPMSNNTINLALRRLGYTNQEMTAHGFRSMASTLLNEQGWNRDAIERQLAHAERDAVRAAYNYAEFMPERGKMMQAWANYLDTLKARAAGNEVRDVTESLSAV